MTIKYLPPIKDVPAGCLCCPSTEPVLCMKTVLYNGYGGWSITKNGAQYFTEDQNKDWSETKVMAEIEKEASQDPENDWRAELYLPLREATYQRQGEGKWMLVRTGEGFA